MSIHPPQNNTDPQKFATEISGIISELINTARKGTQNQDSSAAKRLAHYLSDRFADGGDQNDLFARATREFVKRAKLTLEPKLALKFQDMIDVALARVDRKASIDYWMRDENGKSIPLSELQKFELDFIDYAHEEGLVAIIFSPMGSGKLQPVDSKILTPNGWKLMGDIQLGDFVIGKEGKPVKVRGIYPQGTQDVFRVNFSDGSFTECGDEHLWQVQTLEQRYAQNHEGRYNRHPKGRNKYTYTNRKQGTNKFHSVKKLADIRHDLKDSAGNRRYFIPIVEPVEFTPKANLLIDPYVLGLFLGDGSLSTSSIRFTKYDLELVEAIRESLAFGSTIESNSIGKDWTIKTKERKYNPLRDNFKALDLFGKRSWEKFIPEVYKFASIKDRLALLQGLMDTDGSPTGTSTSEYCTTSEQLAKDVQFLVWSLGGICKIKSRITRYAYKGEKKEGRVSYRVSVKLSSGMNPFRLKRKAEQCIAATKYPVARAIESVEFVGRKECQCISVEAEDGLYVTDDFIVTHNTTVLVGSIAFEIGQDQNTMEQLVAATDGTAEDRGNSVLKILESPHYQKIFPHIQPTKKWSGHKFFVQRTRAESEFIFKGSDGDAGGVSPTFAAYGATSGALGSRSIFSNFDDLATYENSIKNPSEGEHIEQLLTSKFFSRKKSPIGVADEDYDRKKNPWRARIIGTPWAYNDPIYKLRDWKGAAVVVIGVNQTVTAYNAEIWGMPDKYINRLKQKYGVGNTENYTLTPELFQFCSEKGLPTDNVFQLGPGRIVDKINPPKAQMELRLSRPRKWYLEELKNAKDVRVEFDRPYRCQVFSEGELAYPGFGASLFEYYQDVTQIDTHTRMETQIPIRIEKEEIKLKRGDGIQLESIGWRARMVDPPKNSGHKIACVDLSGMNREGCVITIATLTSENRRRLDEIVIGRFAGEELPVEIGKVFERHPDLLLCYIESVSMQDLYVRLIEHHKKDYPWWSKVVHFTDTAHKKNDQQVGILTMGVTFAHGGFEIPDTRKPIYTEKGHGYTCGCGYCVLIRDAVMQTRLAPVKSDVLITVWGIHLNMPHSFDYGSAVSPSTYSYTGSGYGLMQAGAGSVVGEYIFGGAAMAVPTERQEQILADEQEFIETEIEEDSENPSIEQKRIERKGIDPHMHGSPARSLLSQFGIVRKLPSDQEGWN